MALLAVAADKGSPGVTTSAVALAAVWPRPVLLAECDPAGGDLVFRLRGSDRGTLDTRRGLLSLAVAARRGVPPEQVWEHVQKVHGGLDILAGVTSAEQGAGLDGLWGTIGAVLADLPQADVIADCGRIGVDGPFYDLLAQASITLMISGASLGEVIRLRDRAAAVAAGLLRRGRPGASSHAAIIASPRHLSAALGEVGQALGNGNAVALVGGIAHDPKSAESLRGAWGGKLDKSMLMRTARQIATAIAGQLPAAAGLAAAGPPVPDRPAGPALPGRPAAPSVRAQPAAAPAAGTAGHSGQLTRSASPGHPAGEVPLAPRPQPMAAPVPHPMEPPAAVRAPIPAGHFAEPPSRGRHADPAGLAAEPAGPRTARAPLPQAPRSLARPAAGQLPDAPLSRGQVPGEDRPDAPGEW
jgi:hypothetical protein